MVKGKGADSSSLRAARGSILQYNAQTKYIADLGIIYLWLNMYTV